MRVGVDSIDIGAKRRREFGSRQVVNHQWPQRTRRVKFKSDSPKRLFEALSPRCTRVCAEPVIESAVGAQQCDDLAGEFAAGVWVVVCCVNEHRAESLHLAERGPRGVSAAGRRIACGETRARKCLIELVVGRALAVLEEVCEDCAELYKIHLVLRAARSVGFWLKAPICLT